MTLQISGLDDLPFHQHARPMDVPTTSDPHFNDGFYFSAYTEGWYLAAGLRLHPNNNVMDGFAGVVRGPTQRCLRSSRTLRPDVDDLTVGPVTIATIESLARHRVSVEPKGLGSASNSTSKRLRHRSWNHRTSTTAMDDS